MARVPVQGRLRKLSWLWRHSLCVLFGDLATYAAQQQQAKSPHILGRMGAVAALVHPGLGQLWRFEAHAKPARAAHLLANGNMMSDGTPDWDNLTEMSTITQGDVNACYLVESTSE